MKAIVLTTYGPPDLLALREMDTPAPKANEVLIKIHAASVNAAEWHLIRGAPFPVRFMTGGLAKPKPIVLGADVAGRVEAVGAAVTRFKPGDEVYGDLSGSGWGGFAEYACAPESALAFKPAGVSFEAAAAAPMAAVTALQGLRDKGRLKAGQRVLVNGAGGGVGMFAVLIAKALGAEVTATSSAGKLEMVRGLGADEVLDYGTTDPTRGSRRFDLVFDPGAYRSFGAYRRILNPGGAYVLAGGSMARLAQVMIFGPLASLGGKTFANFMTKPNIEDLALVGELMASGKVAPFIGARYPLSEVAEAIRHLETGKARGKVVITV